MLLRMDLGKKQEKEDGFKKVTGQWKFSTRVLA